MRRVHLFEFMDLDWYPETFRRIQTDYLQFVATRGAGHENLVPLIKKALRRASTDQVVDLCSGGTGPWLKLREHLARAGCPVRITLTDKFPHPQTIARWARAPEGSIAYLTEPVDAINVPAHLPGMRTLFEGFHHLRPEEARAILQDAADDRAAIGIFEASLKPPLGPLFLILSPLMTILGYLFATPFITPRTPARFLWTYLLPIVPITTSLDGVVSLLRVYGLDQLRELTSAIDCHDYTWEMGVAETGTPIFAFTYLLGYPAPEDDD